MRSQGYRCWKKMWHKYLIGFCTQIVSRHALSARIKRINKRLAKITENQKEYNIGHTPILAPVTSSTTATSAWQDIAVGFENDVAILEYLLFRKGHKRQMFISILGESGVGKETLVKMLLHNKGLHGWTSFLVRLFQAGPRQVGLEIIRREFKVIIWFNVPSDSTLDFLLEECYKRAVEWCTRADLHQPKKDDVNDDITDKLRRILEKKRYLVIIGGISSKTMLNCVRASLPDDNNGSRVLLVLDIENEEVAWHADSMNHQGFNGIHMLGRLDEKRSGELFCSRAFRRDVIFRKQHMYDNIIYEITGGYPLAIVVLAGLLRFKERPGQWEAMLQQLRPLVQDGGHGGGQLRPPVQGSSGSGGGGGGQLRTLVQDGGGGGDSEGKQKVTTEVIVQSSTSQANNNLVSSSTRRTTIERVFWASFEDLPNDLKSCFLYCAAFPNSTNLPAGLIIKMWMAEGFIKPQKGMTMEELGHNYLKELVLRCLVQIVKTTETGGISSISVHRRLQGFLQSEAREAGFMEVHDMHHVFVPPSVRRLSFMSLGGRYTPFTNKFPKLRSFVCWVEEEEQHVSSSTDSRQDLKFLCGSKFLRVICVQGLRVKELPNRIGDMIHLRFLGVHCKDMKELPSSIKRLLNLQTLDIRGTQVEKIDLGFWKIRTLRHVSAEKLTLPETIEEELPELQTLSGVKPTAAQGGEWKKEQNCPLHKMPNLRTLKLHGIAHEKHRVALKSALVKMHLLCDLSLQGDGIPSCVFTAPSLRFLETVELDGTVEWPDQVGWDASKVRPNLIKVKLRNSNNEAVPQRIQEKLKGILLVDDEE